MSPEKQAAIARLEPEVAPLAQRLLDEELALFSIAASLKRIADALTTAGLGLTADVSNMVATMAYEAGRNFEGGRRNG